MTKAVGRNNNESSTSLGHAYVVFKNDTSTNKAIGYYSLKPNQTVSVGLWTSSALGSYSSTSSNALNHNGVYYNYERMEYNYNSQLLNDIYLSRSIDLDTLYRLNKVIINKNDSYDVLFYNCATFATELWNIVAGTSYWTGISRTPANCRHEIEANYSSDFLNGNNHLISTTSFYYYETSSSSLVRS